jgi:hypothetical protein
MVGGHTAAVIFNFLEKVTENTWYTAFSDRIRSCDLYIDWSECKMTTWQSYEHFVITFVLVVIIIKWEIWYGNGT